MNRSVTIITNVCRALLALTFIFSGYIKAIDPLGTQYKINDYLAALSMADTLPGWITLTVAVLLAALEFSMGVFMLCAIRRRQAPQLKSIVREIDPEAFVILQEAHQVLGEGFRRNGDEM